MSLFSYLDEGLMQDGKAREDLQPHVEAVAQTWLAAGTDPAPVELLSEYLARTATHLGEQAIDGDLLALTAWMAPEPAVRELLAAAARVRTNVELTALAVHLLEIAERMALLLFLPEIEGLTARAERTGGAARSVGLARHLKG